MQYDFNSLNIAVNKMNKAPMLKEMTTALNLEFSK